MTLLAYFTLASPPQSTNQSRNCAGILLIAYENLYYAEGMAWWAHTRHCAYRQRQFRAYALPANSVASDYISVLIDARRGPLAYMRCALSLCVPGFDTSLHAIEMHGLPPFCRTRRAFRFRAPSTREIIFLRFQLGLSTEMILLLRYR